MQTLPETIAAPFTDLDTDTDGALTLSRAATSGVTPSLHHAAVGYSAAPTNGAFEVDSVHPDGSPTTEVFKVDLPGAGHYEFPFPGGIYAAKGYGLNAVLTAGGAGIVGYANTKGYPMQGLPETIVVPTFEKDIGQSAGVAANITVAAVSNRAHVVDWIYASLSADSDAIETLSISYGGTEVWKVDFPITAGAGVYPFDFSAFGLHNNTVNEALTIDFTGAGTTGLRKINARVRTMPLPINTVATVILDNHWPGTNNTAATKTITANTTERHVLDWVTCSYDLVPAAAESLRVDFPSATAVWQTSIATGGPVHFTFPGGLYSSSINQTMRVLLTKMTGQFGKINFGYR